MANSLLTIDMITRKALEILENNLVLTRNVNRQYDDSFAVEGAKIGSTLRIRLPDRALVTDGAALQTQDDNEQYTTLAVASQKHIGINFTSAELTMQLDDFAERVLKPRISQLAASIDADVANAYKAIGNSVGTPGTTPSTSLVLLQAQQKLNENAALKKSTCLNRSNSTLLEIGVRPFPLGLRLLRKALLRSAFPLPAQAKLGKWETYSRFRIVLQSIRRRANPLARCSNS